MSTGGHKIKVVCRVRPFLKSEKPDKSVSVESGKILRATNPRDSTKDVKYNFDACYGPTVGQDTIYKNDVRPLVETIFSGMSATVFCYGVTGAGKTHTIQGTETDPGIIPRAMEHVFKHKERDAVGYDIRMSYFEIYKEAVFDLLKPRDSTGALPIREDANRKIFVAGLSEKRVESYEQFDSLYQRACGNRSTASTKLNNHSSRSHAILTVRVQWTDDIGEGKTWCGRLHLIDLAGSEDNRRTENGRDRMAESSAINRSLFVLGQVVEALNTGAARIPYRDSKMTRILQDSLGGECLGMMIVNVAPGDYFLQDTQNTLNFATRSREVVNKPVAHEVVEQRWTVADRLQHHRGAGQPLRTTVVAAVGTKRRRSDEPGRPTDEDVSPPIGTRHAQSQPVSVSGGEQRRPVAAARMLGRGADAVAQRPAGTAQQAGGQRRPDTASNEIMERVLRIEKQLSTKQLDADVVLDLFTPATKLKTSRGWLKHARELEQKGELEKAIAHYEEALRYAPELNKLESHIAKLRAKLRRQKRRSSIVTHGSANVKVEAKASADGPALLVPGGSGPDGGDEDDDEDVGHLWMRDGLAESPGAEKAERSKRRALTAAGVKLVPNGAAGARPALNGSAAAKLALNGSATAKMALSGSASAKTVLNGSGVAKLTLCGAPAAGARPADKPQTKRRRVLSSDGKRTGSVTEGSVHDRRISFGGSQLNPFVVGGSEFNTDLQRRLEQRKAAAAAAARGSLPTQKLMAKSAAAARLQRSLAEPPTPTDRNDKDFVPQSDSANSSDAELPVLGARQERKPGRRGARLPGSLGVRGLVERRLAESTCVDQPSAEPTKSSAEPTKPRRVSAAEEEPLRTDGFNDISIASALQMINSAEVKKIMKLQGIGKRRAEQIQESVRANGPLKHVSELQSRLQFKNKLIMGILSTFA